MKSLNAHLAEAVAHYWRTREGQAVQQTKAGRADQGARSAVTGGAQMNGFIKLISGLIVEKGSMLSHSAIVAREMGIPAVVGVKDATRILCDGDRVVLDGAAGTVTVVSERCAS